MPDRTSVPLWHHSIRMLLWLLVGWTIVAGAVSLILAAVTVKVVEEGAVPFIVLPVGVAAVLLPFVVAFYFGRELGGGMDLTSRQSGLVGLGGAGLLVLVGLVWEFYSVWSGGDEPSMERFAISAVAYVLFIPMIAAMTALGARRARQ